MPDRPSLLEPYRQLQIGSWFTWEEGLIRNRAFPHSVAADYNGHPTNIRFGAFLGWVENVRWWVDLASRLSLPSLDGLDLLGVEHQAAGHSCIPWSCVATPVAIRHSHVRFVGDLCSHYYHAHGGWMDGWCVSENEQYLERLGTVGLTANCLSEYKGLMESVYPVDATDENFEALLAHPHKALADLAPLLSDTTARERLRIFILADNSD